MPRVLSATATETLPAALRHWGDERAEELAFVFLENGERESARLTWGALRRRTLALSAHLRTRGLTGRPVVLNYPPGLDLITAFCACLDAGVIAVVIPHLLPNRSTDRIDAIAASARPAALLTHRADDALEGVAALAGLPVIATEDWPDDGRGPDGGPTPSPDAIAFLQYSSGSTGAPKGAVVTHENLIANLRMLKAGLDLEARPRSLNWLPLFHDMGLVANVGLPLYCGGTSVQMSPLAFIQKPMRWLRAISAYGAQVSGGPNFAYEHCLRMLKPEQRDGLDLRSWRVAYCGAEPVRAETLQRFAETFAPVGLRRSAFWPCYGLSEATIFATGGPALTGVTTLAVDAQALAVGEVVPVTDDAAPSRDVVACGQSWGEQRIAIVDPARSRRLPPGRVGEIWLSGPHITRGYWSDAEATARAFGQHLEGESDATYLRTGDLGFLHEDRLFVTGRLKDILIVRGANHHPEDIEHTVALAHPLLTGGAGAAFAIEREGDEPRVVVLQEVPRRTLADLDVEAATRAAATAISERHGIRPDEVRLVRFGSLPRTTSGKVQRHRCRDLYLAGELALV